MGIKRFFKRTIKFNFNIKSWARTDEVKQNASFIGNLCKSLFSVSKSGQNAPSENFEQAMRRQGLTEADLLARIKKAKQMVLLYLLGSLAILAYMTYLFISHLYLSAFICLIVSVLLWAYAFRESFNLYQMRQRRLGCTVREWFNQLINKRKV